MQGLTSSSETLENAWKLTWYGTQICLKMLELWILGAIFSEIQYSWRQFLGINKN